jgi:hypothetical protein
VSVLGLVVLVAMIGAILLGYDKITIPEILTAIRSAAVGSCWAFGHRLQVSTDDVSTN